MRLDSKLEHIAKYTISARHINRRFLYVAYSVFTFSTDLIVALGSIGIGYPLLTRAVAAGPGGKELPPAPVTALSFGLILTVLWVILRLVVTSDNGVKRATLMKSCRKEMLLEHSRVSREALANPQPFPKLEEIHKRLMAIYDRHIQEESWPWAGGFADGKAFETEVKNQVAVWVEEWHKQHGLGASADDEDLRRE